MDISKGCKVLVIDKDSNVGDLLELILHHRGDQVRTTFDEHKGLALAEQDPPDLILLDSEMLEDEVYQQFKRLPALQNVPILFLDAKAPYLVCPQAQRLGAAGYLCKPFKVEDLLAARDAVLRGETYYPPLPEEAH
jgi:two-component system, OmpR family, phosphate regulon response regulator PhoB